MSGSQGRACRSSGLQWKLASKVATRGRRHVECGGWHLAVPAVLLGNSGRLMKSEELSLAVRSGRTSKAAVGASEGVGALTPAKVTEANAVEGHGCARMVVHGDGARVFRVCGSLCAWALTAL